MKAYTSRSNTTMWGYSPITSEQIEEAINSLEEE